METFNSARSSPLSPINAVVADHGTTTTLEEITIFDPRSLTVWHPKATPYRLLVLVVGIVLGTLKTVFGFKGMVLVSTTLEWALGTIIFIVFYILQLFEENSRTHGRHRSWFFGYDCMNMLWRLLERFNIPPPVYSTFEEFDPQLCGGQLVVTNYRVLLSFAVIIFGFVKAVLTYRNLSLSASIIDLIFGVVATPILYVVGLYEDNPSKRLPVLFNRNDSWTIYKIGGYGDLFFFLLWTNCLLTGEYVFKVFIFEVGLMGSISPLIPMFIRGYISMALGIFHYVERALPRTIGRDLRHIISAAFPVAIGYCMSILVFLTLFGPVVSVQLLRPYFEQDRVLGRWFISLQQSYSMTELPMLIRIIQRLGAYVKKIVAIGVYAFAIYLSAFRLVMLTPCCMCMLSVTVIVFQYRLSPAWHAGALLGTGVVVPLWIHSAVKYALGIRALFTNSKEQTEVPAEDASEQTTRVPTQPDIPQ